MGKTVFTGHLRRNGTFIYHRGLCQVILRQALGRLQVLKVYAVLTSYQRLQLRCAVCSRQGSLHTVLVLQREHPAQLCVVVRVAKTAQRIIVEEYSVALRADEKRYAHLCVILKQLLVTSLIVPLGRLVLSQSIQSLAMVQVFKHRACAPSVVCLRSAVSVCLGAGVAAEPFSASLYLFYYSLTLMVGKPYLTRSLQYMSVDSRCSDGHHPLVLLYLIVGVSLLRRYYKAGAVSKVLLCRGRHMYDVGVNHLKTHQLGRRFKAPHRRSAVINFNGYAFCGLCTFGIDICRC